MSLDQLQKEGSEETHFQNFELDSFDYNDSRNLQLYSTSALEILRETAGILRCNPWSFMTIAALLICPVSAILLSNVLVDQSIVKRLSTRLLLVAKSSGLPLRPLVKQLCHRFAEMAVSSATCFPLFITLSLLSRAAVVYSVDCTYSRKDVDGSKFLAMISKIWRRIVSTYLWSCMVIVGCLTLFFVLLLAVCSTFLVLGFWPELNLYAAMIAGLVFSVIFANAIIVCNIAVVISVLVDVSGPQAVTSRRRRRRRKELRASYPRSAIMPPDTRTTDLKRIEDSIAAVSQDHNLKYELMADLLKGQNVKLDQTIANQGAQIRDMQGIMSTMAQQLDLALHKLSSHSGSPSQGRDKQVSGMDGLFEHRVKTLSYGDGSSRIWEGPLLVIMYSFVVLIDLMMSAVFYYSCRSHGMEASDGECLSILGTVTVSAESDLYKNSLLIRKSHGTSLAISMQRLWLLLNSDESLVFCRNVTGMRNITFLVFTSRSFTVIVAQSHKSQIMPAARKVLENEPHVFMVAGVMRKARPKELSIKISVIEGQKLCCGSAWKELDASPRAHHRIRRIIMDSYIQEKIHKFEEFVDGHLKPQLVRAIAERSDLRRNIENLEKNSVTNLRTMVNLGSEVYMQADVPDTQRIFVDVGLGFHVEFTWTEALNFIALREEKIASYSTREGRGCLGVFPFCLTRGQFAKSRFVPDHVDNLLALIMMNPWVPSITWTSLASSLQFLVCTSNVFASITLAIVFGCITTLEIFKQIEEYTRLISSIKARIKLVCEGIRELLQLPAEKSLPQRVF
ncbi:hypothetical protein POTOM_031404 [Populus tomentosa]|uniref:Uncharacterized protein n=1 Tax=Populus tomentosa TaxID=118781 RepID=A0A8X8CSI1_POPTO|nr:hypothetical protein POTOM_031404 [Populus tomentosa]